MAIGFVTTAESNGSLILAKSLVRAANPADAPEVSNVDNEATSRAGIRFGRPYGHASTSTSTFHTKTTSHQPVI
jgi:hypothetical protein